MAAHSDTGTMASPGYYSSKLLDHLGLVAGMYDELGLGDLIDRVLPQDQDKRTVSLGQSSDEGKAFEQLCQQEFACEVNARQALAAFEKTLQISLVCDAQVTAQARYQDLGRPAQGRTPDFYGYRIAGQLASNPAQRTRQLERKSCFILATNELDCAALSDQQLLAAYKDQQKVERGFRFLKDPLFMASSLFLKSPSA